VPNPDGSIDDVPTSKIEQPQAQAKAEEGRMAVSASAASAGLRELRSMGFFR
jgi:hypothetical protein